MATARAEDLLVAARPTEHPHHHRRARARGCARPRGRGAGANRRRPCGRAVGPGPGSPSVEREGRGGPVARECSKHTRAVEPLLGATATRLPEVRAAASRALDEMGTAAVIVGVSLPFCDRRSRTAPRPRGSQRRHAGGRAIDGRASPRRRARRGIGRPRPRPIATRAHKTRAATAVHWVGGVRPERPRASRECGRRAGLSSAALVPLVLSTSTTRARRTEAPVSTSRSSFVVPRRVRSRGDGSLGSRIRTVLAGDGWADRWNGRTNIRRIRIVGQDLDEALSVGRLRERLSDGSAARIVVVTRNCGPLGLRRALRAGADAVVLEDELAGTLTPALRAVAAGLSAVPARVRRAAEGVVLSHREREVLRLAVGGRLEQRDRRHAVPCREHRQEPSLVGLSEARSGWTR